jgi:hypothetical protein
MRNIDKLKIRGFNKDWSDYIFWLVRVARIQGAISGVLFGWLFGGFVTSYIIYNMFVNWSYRNHLAPPADSYVDMIGSTWLVVGAVLAALLVVYEFWSIASTK